MPAHTYRPREIRLQFGPRSWSGVRPAATAAAMVIGPRLSSSGTHCWRGTSTTLPPAGPIANALQAELRFARNPQNTGRPDLRFARKPWNPCRLSGLAAPAQPRAGGAGG